MKYHNNIMMTSSFSSPILQWIKSKKKSKRVYISAYYRKVNKSPLLQTLSDKQLPLVKKKSISSLSVIPIPRIVFFAKAKVLS